MTAPSPGQEAGAIIDKIAKRQQQACGRYYVGSDRDRMLLPLYIWRQRIDEAIAILEMLKEHKP